MPRDTAMARSPKLKVFRTPIGFHDAYVAAPSQKAALAAWGSDRDLFARGIAELVTDQALSAEPLAQPGVVIRKSRGSAAEQLAAAPQAPPRPAGKPKKKEEAAPPRQRAAKPPPPLPRPSRDALAEAEDAVTAAQARFAREQRDLADQEARLARHRRQLERDHTRELERLDARRDRADRDYRIALSEWRSSRD